MSYCPLKALAWIPLFSVMYLTSIIKADESVLPKRQNAGQIDCLTSDGQGGTCLPFQDCLKIGETSFRQRPTTCRWDTFGPIICCPTLTKTSNLTCGLSLRTRRQIALDGEEPANHTTEGQDPFIIGGENADLGEWPWMSLLFLEDDQERNFPICGAALISETEVLTAAHCFLGRTDSKYVIRLGEHNLAKTSRSTTAVETKVEKVILHEGFNYPAIYNDIALLKLEHKVKFSNRIQPVCLPKDLKKDDFVGKKTVVTGWGQKEYGGSSAKVLQEVEVTVFRNSECEAKYNTIPGAKHNIPDGINQTILCAGSDTEAKDACPGDSGGPLVFKSSSQNWILIGVVSAGFDCGKKIPGLYTRVTEYLAWISKKSQ